jgi:hypothetical protein
LFDSAKLAEKRPGVLLDDGLFGFDVLQRSISHRSEYEEERILGRPPRKFIGDERGGCATIFIDRYTISVIEKCEAYEAKRCRH